MAAPLSKWITIGIPVFSAGGLVLLLVLLLVAWRVRRVRRMHRMPADPEPRL